MSSLRLESEGSALEKARRRERAEGSVLDLLSKMANSRSGLSGGGSVSLVVPEHMPTGAGGNSNMRRVAVKVLFVILRRLLDRRLSKAWRAWQRVVDFNQTEVHLKSARGLVDVAGQAKAFVDEQAEVIMRQGAESKRLEMASKRLDMALGAKDELVDKLEKEKRGLQQELKQAKGEAKDAARRASVLCYQVKAMQKKLQKNAAGFGKLED